MPLEEAVSDYFKLALLDLHDIQPLRVEYDGRYWAFFDSEKARPILTAFDDGTQKESVRDYSRALISMKSRIFEMARIRQTSKGASHVQQHKQRNNPAFT
jgi:hypothetical protein